MHWFLEHDNEFTLLKWPPQSPDLNPIEHLWDVVEREIRIIIVQPTNLEQLHYAIMSVWTKILLSLCHEVLRQFWRQKGVQPSNSKVYLIKWPVCVYTYIYSIHTHIYIYIYIYIKTPNMICITKNKVTFTLNPVYTYWTQATLSRSSSASCRSLLRL